ncbi:MAG TPA: Spy/CpxP family protein refolding chaperone [Thermoanaerobaculia bacterium]|nr:Spy/CpxP family protein refolding chaperone [Thermoanaerobaculia bacterium]
MKKRSIILSILTVVTLIGATFVYAAPRGGFEGHHRGPGGPGGFGMDPLGHLAHAKDELGLSDAQVDQIKAIFKDLHEQNAQYREQMHGGFGAIADALIANPNDTAAAQKILDQQAQTERAMKSNFLQATSKALNVLTPEQRTKLASMVAEHRDRRER